MLNTKRFLWLDELRGFAVVIMIIFHFTFDLALFNLINVNFDQGFWYGFPRFIAGLFLFCVGISLELAHTPKIKFPIFYKRILILIFSSILVSVITYLQDPEKWVYLGTLHCIGICSIFALPFIGRPKIQGLFLILIVFLQYFLNFDIAWVSGLINKPSVDFIPPYPWFWVVLLGMLFKHTNMTDKAFLPNKLHHALCYLGRHSLIIYLIHQPILFSCCWAIKKLI